MSTIECPKSKSTDPFLSQRACYPEFVQVSRDTDRESGSARSRIYDSFAPSSALASTSLTKLESGSLRYGSTLPIKYLDQFPKDDVLQPTQVAP
jgi:hypothetical protein